MRRTASEIIHDLEIRVARLEKQATKGALPRDFLDMLTVYIVRYDRRKQKDWRHNPNFLRIALESVKERITDKLERNGLLDDPNPEILEILRKLIPLVILHKAITNPVVKAIEKFQKDGTIPKFK